MTPCSERRSGQVDTEEDYWKAVEDLGLPTIWVDPPDPTPGGRRYSTDDPDPSNNAG